MDESRRKTSPEELKSQSNYGLGVRHLQFFLLSASTIIFYGQRTTLSVAVIAMTDENPPNPDIPTYPKWTNTDTLLSAFFWGYIITQIGAGQLAERFGPKWFLVSTMTLGSIFNIVVPQMAAALGPTGVMICRVIQGLNQGFLFPSIHNLISRWSSIYERTRIAGWVYSGASLGIVFSMLFSGAVCGSQLGWPWVFYFYGGAGVAYALIFALFGANSPSEHRSISQEERDFIESSNSVSKDNTGKVQTPWKSIFTSLPLWATFITTCAQAWGSFTLLTEIPSFLSKFMNFDIHSNSQLSALPYLVMFLMSFTTGFVADKLISTRLISIGTTRKVLNSLATIVPGLALFTLGFVTSEQKDLAVVLLVVSVGFSAYNHHGASINLIDLAPNHAGTLMGLANGTSQIFSILGPLTVEFFGDDKTQLLLWRKVFWLAAGIYIVGGLFFIAFSSGELQEWNDSETLERNANNDKKIKIVP